MFINKKASEESTDLLDKNITGSNPLDIERLQRKDTDFSSLNGKEDIYKAAIALIKKGYSAGIVNKDKYPVLSQWKKYQETPATEEEIFNQIIHPEAHGICIFTGYGDFNALDIDLKYDRTGTLDKRLFAEIEKHLPGFLSKAVVVISRSGGKHIYYLCKESLKNQKLASRHATEEEKTEDPKIKTKCLIETRGAGGLIVTAPTPGYKTEQRGELSYITREEQETLFAICRSFNEVYKEDNTIKNTEPYNVYEITPWEDFNQRGDVISLLEKHGWKTDEKFGTKVRLIRPGKTFGTSAEWDSSEGKFYVWTSSSEFENEHGYTPYSVFKILECSGDASKAAKDLESLGYGVRISKEDRKKERQPAIDVETLVTWLHGNYKLRRNEINRRIELNGREMQQSDFNSIYLAAKKEFPKINYDLLERSINSDFTPVFNPLKDFIEKHKELKPQGLIKKLAESIKSDTGFEGSEFLPDFVYYFVSKWYVSIIASIYDQHSPLMLVLCGSRQGTGKTEWFRRLLPEALKRFYAESKLDAGKDDEILMCQKLLISDDEFGGKSKKDEKRIKEVLSREYFTLREPYGRHNVDLKRLAVLCGTTNDFEILSDPTGNRRIIPVNVLEIDHQLYNSIDKTELFMEAYHLFKSGYEWTLSWEDIRALNKNTAGFEQTSLERDLLAENFKVPQSEEDPTVVFLTTSKIKALIEMRTHQRLNTTRLGMELRKMTGLMDRASKKINGQSVKGYYLIDRYNEVVSGQ